MDLRAKCVRDGAGPDDGERLLVTRFRPQGFDENGFDSWDKRLAPSALLMMAWRNHWVTWKEFASIYVAEMWGQAAALRELGERAQVHPVTLLCQCGDERTCHRTLLRSLVADMFRSRHLTVAR